MNIRSLRATQYIRWTDWLPSRSGTICLYRSHSNFPSIFKTFPTTDNGQSFHGPYPGRRPPSLKLTCDLKFWKFFTNIFLAIFLTSVGVSPLRLVPMPKLSLLRTFNAYDLSNRTNRHLLWTLSSCNPSISW